MDTVRAHLHPADTNRRAGDSSGDGGGSSDGGDGGNDQGDDPAMPVHDDMENPDDMEWPLRKSRYFYPRNLVLRMATFVSWF